MGSNLEPFHWVPKAAEAIVENFGNLESSAFYRTDPIGRPDQPEYINAVWRVTSDLDRREIVKILKRVENLCGRKRDPEDSYASRTMDLDLLGRDHSFFDEKELAERAFLRRSILDVEPEWKGLELFQNTPTGEFWKVDEKLSEIIKDINKKKIKDRINE